MGCGPSIHDELIHNQSSVRLYKQQRAPMPLTLKEDQDFLIHHLLNQLRLSQYVTSDKIRRRQILAHLNIQILKRKPMKYYPGIIQMITKSFYQRIFLDIIKDADLQYFQKNIPYDQVRIKIAERYLFELYQFREYLESTIGYNFEDKKIDLSILTFSSDSALLPVLKYLKQKYPEVQENSNIQLPQINEMKKDVNLLMNFPSKYQLEPQYCNINTLFHDLKYLIDKSTQQFQDFKLDMIDILGEDVLTDSKVKLTKKNQKYNYTASPVRRILIKWVETLLERSPVQIKLTQPFINFIKSKKTIPDNFHIRSTPQNESTHEQVINILTKLLDQGRFIYENEIKKNQKFGFFIYDLLRCKIHKPSGVLIVQILQKMKSIKQTKSGKMFQIIRIKNRLKTPNRDVMVNFRYGDVLVAQAQLCIDISVSEKSKKTNKFNHYLYELQRGLFGPTIQLMMQYEDYYRDDVQVNMYMTGQIVKRVSKKPYGLKFSEIKCPYNHQMIQMKQNYFDQQDNSKKQTFQCQICYQIKKFKDYYYYCYICTIRYCKSCIPNYKKIDKNLLHYRCNYQNIIQEISNRSDLLNYLNLNRAVIIFFYLPNNSPSILCKDYIIYLSSFLKLNNTKLKLIFCNVQTEFGKQLSKQLWIQNFPTFTVVNKKLECVKAVIGANIEYLKSLIDITQLVSRDLPPYLQLQCSQCNNKLQLKNSESKNWRCNFCFKSKKFEKLENIADMFENIQKLQRFVKGDEYIYQCKKCNTFSCSNCCFIGLKQKSFYRCVQGFSYLSFQKKKPLIEYQCKNKHTMQYTYKNQYQKITFSCINCSRTFYFTEQNGMSQCKLCQQFACSQCIGIQIIKFFKQKNLQYIDFKTQARAADALQCLKCNNFFKKVYQSRILYKDKKNMQKDRLKQILWSCNICGQKYRDGRLHLACFFCKINICFKCVSQYHILGNKSIKIQQIISQQVKFKCSQNHNIIKTNISQDDKLSFLCAGQCKKNIYINTLHYKCKQCNKDYCISCGTQQLTFYGKQQCVQGHSLQKIISSPAIIGTRCKHDRSHLLQPSYSVWKCTICVQYYVCQPKGCIGDKFKLNTANKKCNEGHKLQKKAIKSKIGFCNICLGELKNGIFRCEICDYDICLKCGFKT